MFSETFQVILATLHGYVNCGLSRMLELMLDIFCSSLQVCYLRREAYVRVCQGVILLREKKRGNAHCSYDDIENLFFFILGMELLKY